MDGMYTIHPLKLELEVFTLKSQQISICTHVPKHKKSHSQVSWTALHVIPQVNKRTNFQPKGSTSQHPPKHVPQQLDMVGTRYSKPRGWELNGMEFKEMYTPLHVEQSALWEEMSLRSANFTISNLGASTFHLFSSQLKF